MVTRKEYVSGSETDEEPLGRDFSAGERSSSPKPGPSSVVDPPIFSPTTGSAQKRPGEKRTKSPKKKKKKTQQSQSKTIMRFFEKKP